jgi:hypothetical protein
MINPSSKMSLKMTCLASCKGDIDQAMKLYNFLADGVESMPDFDIPRPSVFDQLKESAGQVYGWVRDNKDDLMQAVEYIQSMRNGASTAVATTETAATEIPPLPTLTEQS